MRQNFNKKSNLTSKVLITDQKDLFKLIVNSIPKFQNVSRIKYFHKRKEISQRKKSRIFFSFIPPC